VCGLAGSLNYGAARPHPEVLKAMLVAQTPRGRDSTGIAFNKDGKIWALKEAVEPRAFVANTVPAGAWKDIARSPIILMHARHATQGPKTDNRNNHPVLACEWVTVHNGQIRNDDPLIQMYGMTAERPADVDTVAINMALAQGDTVEESIKHLSMLEGTATFMAMNETRPEQLLIGRINGPPLYFHLDKKAQIMYWSSDVDGLRSTGRGGFGDLKFVNVSTMPNNTVFLYDNGTIRQFKIEVRPFYMPKPVKPMSSHLPAHYRGHQGQQAGTPGGPLAVVQSNIPEIPAKVMETGGDESSLNKNTDLSHTIHTWMDKARGMEGDEPILFTKGAAITPHEDYPKLGKYAPNFEAGMVGMAELPPLRSAEYITPYGTWLLTPHHRFFRGAKRVKEHWTKMRDKLGLNIILPAGTKLQEELKGMFRLEVLRLYPNKKATQYSIGLMCPWCGIISKPQTWKQNGYNCSWCKVRSQLRIGKAEITT